MRGIVALDIETIPNEDQTGNLPDPDVKYGNTKDPEKRKAIEDEARKDQVEGMALNPFYGRICCVAICDDKGTAGLTITDLSDEAEKNIVQYAFDTALSFNSGNSPKIVTWNGMNFDLPFIYKRAMILGVKVSTPITYWSKRYQTTPHCDLMQVFSGWAQKGDKLENVSKAILGEKKTECDFRLFLQMIKDGQQNKIQEYCMHDAMLTYKLYEKASGILF